MRIAIVGAGITGIGAALALGHQSGHQVVLFEKDQRPGGHSATVDIDYDGQSLAVDTGFIVYNELNYPQFAAMLAWLDVDTQAADMSFSVSADGGRYEWCGRDEQGRSLGFLKVLNGLFARRRNLLSVSHMRMLRDVLRFQEQARADRTLGTIGSGSLAEYLARHGFSVRLRDDYLVPMGAAIWSTSPARMLEFPAQTFIDFFDNHCLLQWKRPQWRTVAGGSRTYVRRATELLGMRVKLGAGAATIRRLPHGVEVTDTLGATERFDHVVLACHAPDSLALLTDADAQERAILGACAYSANEVYLHRDPALMPKRKAAWAAWNFLREGQDADRKVAVSYWMNVLQNIPRSRPVFVTLNPPRPPAAHLTFARFTYDHPQFDAKARRAVADLWSIQGGRRTWFAGAWTGYGFHEDGLRSGLSVAEALGGKAPWSCAPAPLLQAAE